MTCHPAPSLLSSWALTTMTDSQGRGTQRGIVVFPFILTWVALTSLYIVDVDVDVYYPLPRASCIHWKKKHEREKKAVKLFNIVPHLPPSLSSPLSSSIFLSPSLFFLFCSLSMIPNVLHWVCMTEHIKVTWQTVWCSSSSSHTPAVCRIRGI